MSNLKQVPYSNQGKTMTSQGACLSGTGVFYQAMPAVGTDGRNVMKLIPVQKVNGQFVRLPTNTIKGTEPQVDLTLNLTTMSKGNVPTSGSTARGQFRNKSPSPKLIGTSPKPLSLTTGIYPSVRIHTPIVTSKLTQQAGSLPAREQPCGKTLGQTLKQLPVTVKSPVLPNGQYLQIPPNAQVKTLPASALPPAIKRQIFTSSMNCVSNSPTVLYVSPVQTMKQGGSPLSPTSQKAGLSLSCNQGSPGQTVTCPSTCSTQPTTTSKDGRPPVTPIKWVIEEADGSPAPCLVPVKSTSMTSEILKTLAKMEKAKKTSENPTKTFLSPQESGTKIGQEKDNALVMYNGKVYFVAKKTPELSNRPSEPLEGSRNVGDSSTHTSKSIGFNQRISVPPSIPPTSSFGSQLPNATRPDPKHIVIPDDIIDLCDDDPQDDLTWQAVSTKELPEQSLRRPEVVDDDDSNVIFVSYLPPQRVYKVAKDKVVAHMPADLETEQELSQSQCHLNDLVKGGPTKVSVEICPSVGTAQEMAGCQRSATGQELISHQKNTIVTGLEDIEGDATSQEMESSQPTGSIQQMVCVQINATDQGIQNNSAVTQDNIPGSTSLPIETEELKAKSLSSSIHEQQSSMLYQDSLKTYDHMLKKKFGIKSDVKICLKRVDTKPLAIPKVFPWIGTTNKRTIEAIRKLLQGSKIMIKKREHIEMEVPATKNNDSFVKDAKIQKLEKVENTSNSLLGMEVLTNPTQQLDRQHLTSTSPQLDMLYNAEQMFVNEEEPTVTPMDPEEIKRHEKIKRLKELLKEKEAALATIRKNMDSVKKD
ncbi:hypothetical protein DPEC_G00007330 [Dallia pectoralis]|uniref:Uncharacterized protein n=1 Tax=Dallia pectoralis TaxID=75939 RepID=A0ACC2HLB7_DALPE|nr:hypothetical protein DPEC_G00007330 [Dallia pectoralis]